MGLQKPKASKTKGKVWKKESLPSVEENCLRGRLSYVLSDIHKSMGPEGMHPKLLHQGHSWLSLKGHGDLMFLETGRKQRSLLSSRRLSWKCGELQDTEPHLSLWEKIFLKHIFKHMKDKKFFKSSQHVFMRGKHTCPTWWLLQWCH